MAFTAASSAQELRFVDDDAPPGGDGLAWASAYHTLQDALAESILLNSGITEIHLAGGTYQSASPYEIPPRIALIGGYAGPGSEHPDVRDFVLYETILRQDVISDATFPGVDESLVPAGTPTLLDGITMRDSMHVAFTSLDTMVTLRDCTFEQNQGIGVLIQGGEALIDHCRFMGMKTSGILLDSMVSCQNSQITLQHCLLENGLAPEGSALKAWSSNITIDSCTFQFNGALNFSHLPTIGGAILLDGQSIASISGSTFISNMSKTSGGAIANIGSQLEISDCTFEDNQSHDPSLSAGGGAVASIGLFSTAHIKQSQFRNNAARFIGGATLCKWGSMSFDTCEFHQNQAEQGGALMGWSARLEVQSCQLNNNTALTGSGGGIHGRDTHAIIRGSEFNNNIAHAQGGAASLNWSQGSPSAQYIIEDTVFSSNIASHGGGLSLKSFGTAQIRNCQFLSNEALFGGGVFLVGLSVTMDRCLFNSNFAQGSGGGIHASSIKLIQTSNIVRGNRAGISGGGLFLLRVGNSGKGIISNSLYHANQASKNYAIHMGSSRIDFISTTISHNSPNPGDLDTSCEASIGGNLWLEMRFFNSILWEHPGFENNPSQDPSCLSPAIRVVDSWHSILQGLNIDHDHGGNLVSDPRFVDPDGPDDILGNDDDDLRLSRGSPAIDAGINSASSLPLTDLGGNVRVFNDIVDLGAYESQIPPCPADVFPPDGGDGLVNTRDLLFIIHRVGNPHDDGRTPPDRGERPFNVKDLLFILYNWGPCPG